MPETSPAITPRCTRCNSDAVIPDAHVFVPDLGSSRIQVGIERKPDARILKDPARTDVRVRICGDCGLVEVEADDPGYLWDAYVERLSREIR